MLIPLFRDVQLFGKKYLKWFWESPKRTWSWNDAGIDFQHTRRRTPTGSSVLLGYSRYDNSLVERCFEIYSSFTCLAFLNLCHSSYELVLARFRPPKDELCNTLFKLFVLHMLGTLEIMRQVVCHVNSFSPSRIYELTMTWSLIRSVSILPTVSAHRSNAIRTDSLPADWWQISRKKRRKTPRNID